MLPFLVQIFKSGTVRHVAQEAVIVICVPTRVRVTQMCAMFGVRHASHGSAWVHGSVQIRLMNLNTPISDSISFKLAVLKHVELGTC